MNTRWYSSTDTSHGMRFRWGGARGWWRGDLTGFRRTWIDQNRRARESPIVTRRDETCQVLGGGG